MRQRPRHALLLYFFVAGCGGSGAADGGLAAQPHDLGDLGAAVPDLSASAGLDLAGAPDLLAPLGIGAPCPNGNECAPHLTCLGARLNRALPTVGYCTRGCQEDSDCGAGAFCGPNVPGLGSLCYALCPGPESAPAEGCPPGQLCSRHLAGTVELGHPACFPGTASARDGDACQSFSDCNRDSYCASNPFSTPGGYCVTIGCAVGVDTGCSPAPGNAGHCVPLAPGQNGCASGCLKDSDCRAALHYSCAQLGANLPSVCIVVHKLPGEPCAADADCGPSGTPWHCLVTADFPGGYCSAALGTCNPLDPTTCPDGSHCYDPSPVLPKSGDELCTADCKVDADCRLAEGYHCRLTGPNLFGCRP